MSTEAAYHRLDEVHRAWHQALDGYHEVDNFRAGINSAIQSLRNLTFALQNQKDNLPGFEAWYGSWQEKMKNDPVLKAFNDARVVVVHQEDLKLKSTGSARVKNWLVGNNLSFTFNPLRKTEEIANGLYAGYIRHTPGTLEQKRRSIFEFERTWIYEKLPDYELLGALAHAYEFFVELLNDAHQEFSYPPVLSYKTGNFCPAYLNSDGKHKCMVLTREERTLFFSMEDGTGYTAVHGTIERDEEDIKKAQEKYGDAWKGDDIKSLTEGIFLEEFPFNQMRLFLQIALASLKKDKYLVPVSFLFLDEEKPPIVIVHRFATPHDKMLSIDSVADEVIKNKAHYVLNLGEMWTVKWDEKDIETPVSMRKDRREAVGVMALSAREGLEATFPFHKDLLGRIVLSKPQINKFKTDEDHGWNMFLSIISALQKTKDKL